MDSSLAFGVLLVTVGAFALSGYLFNRQKNLELKNLKVKALLSQIHVYNRLNAVFNGLGVSHLARETVHEIRQGFVKQLVEIDPEGGWAPLLGETAPDAPARPDGPFALANSQAVFEVRTLFSKTFTIVSNNASDPVALKKELRALHLLVEIDTLIAEAVKFGEAKSFESARSNANRARGLLMSDLLDEPARDVRRERLQDLSRGLGKMVRRDLEGQLKEGDSVERAFHDLLNDT